MKDFMRGHQTLPKFCEHCTHVVCTSFLLKYEWISACVCMCMKVQKIMNSYFYCTSIVVYLLRILGLQSYIKHYRREEIKGQINHRTSVNWYNKIHTKILSFSTFAVWKSQLTRLSDWPLVKLKPTTVLGVQRCWFWICDIVAIYSLVTMTCLYSRRRRWLDVTRTTSPACHIQVRQVVLISHYANNAWETTAYQMTNFRLLTLFIENIPVAPI